MFGNTWCRWYRDPKEARMDPIGLLNILGAAAATGAAACYLRERMREDDRLHLNKESLVEEFTQRTDHLGNGNLFGKGG